MKCPNCGKEIANGSAYCEFCGAKIQVSNSSSTDVQLSENDKMCLNIIRVGSKHGTKQASFKARKKCYKIIHDFEKRFDYKEHVQQLQLDYFPDEFTKCVKWEDYRKWLIGCIIGIILSTFFSIVGWIGTFDSYYFEPEMLFLAIPTLILSVFFIWLLYKKTKEIRQDLQHK